MKTFTEHVHDCLDNTAATVASWRKPHLRLRVNPGNRYPWSVEYVRGPSQRARKETFNHQTSAGALQSAVTLWF